MNEDRQEKLRRDVIRFLDKHEVTIGAVWVVGILLIKMEMPINVFFVAYSSSLAVLYFFKAFQEIETGSEEVYAVFAFKLGAIGSAVAVVGVLFSVLQWPGDTNMLVGGVIAMLMVVILSQTKKKTVLNTPALFYRSLILLIMSLYFLVF